MSLDDGSRPNPHNPSGTGHSRTRARNRRRRAQQLKGKTMTTCTVDDRTFAEMPDRQALTGSPIVGTYYRDAQYPDGIFRWEKIDGGHGHWIAYKRVAPQP